MSGSISQRGRPIESLGGSINRVLGLDAIKAILILLVVVGHLIQYTVPSYADQYIFRMIYSFHMPAFFILSGISAFLSKSFLSQGFFSYFKKSFFSLYIPYLIWSAILVYTRSDGSENLIKIISNPFAYFWFLEIIFWCLLLARLLIGGGSVLEWAAFIVVLTCIDIFSLNLDGHLRSKQILYYSPYVLVGYYSARWLGTQQGRSYQFKISMEVFYAPLSIACLSAVLIMSYGWGYGEHKHIFQSMNFNATVYTALIYFYRFIIVVFSLSFFYLILGYFAATIINVLASIGRHTLNIYVTHLIVISAILGLHKYPVPFYFLTIMLTAALVISGARLSNYPYIGVFVRYAYGYR